jgi:hypothetical protein
LLMPGFVATEPIRWLYQKGGTLGSAREGGNFQLEDKLQGLSELRCDKLLLFGTG